MCMYIFRIAKVVIVFLMLSMFLFFGSIILHLNLNCYFLAPQASTQHSRNSAFTYRRFPTKSGFLKSTLCAWRLLTSRYFVKSSTTQTKWNLCPTSIAASEARFGPKAVRSGTPPTWPPDLPGSIGRISASNLLEGESWQTFSFLLAGLTDLQWAIFNIIITCRLTITWEEAQWTFEKSHICFLLSF